MFKKLAVALLVCALVPTQASALDNEDLLALVAMPLAVAAVSELTDVPMDDLVDVVTLMNDAAVPPVQFVEVVRYAPAALVVENDQPDFVEFVRLQTQQGVTGLALVNSIEDRIRILGVPEVELVEVTAPVVDVDAVEFIPTVVRTRVAEARAGHPHGGPPGQLKKEVGVQTGAEIVHGSKPGRSGGDDRARVADDDDRGSNRARGSIKPRKVKTDDVAKPKGGGRGRGDDAVMKPRGGQGKGGGNKGGGEGGKGKGKKG